MGTFLCGAGFYFVMRYVVGEYYVRTGEYIPLFVRQLIIFSAISRRFWWALMPLVIVGCFVVSLVVYAIGGDKSQTAAAGPGRGD